MWETSLTANLKVIEMVELAVVIESSLCVYMT